MCLPMPQVIKKTNLYNWPELYNNLRKMRFPRQFYFMYKYYDFMYVFLYPRDFTPDFIIHF